MIGRGIGFRLVQSVRDRTFTMSRAKWVKCCTSLRHAFVCSQEVIGPSVRCRDMPQDLFDDLLTFIANGPIRASFQLQAVVWFCADRPQDINALIRLFNRIAPSEIMMCNYMNCLYASALSAILKVTDNLPRVNVHFLMVADALPALSNYDINRILYYCCFGGIARARIPLLHAIRYFLRRARLLRRLDKANVRVCEKILVFRFRGEHSLQRPWTCIEDFVVSGNISPSLMEHIYSRDLSFEDRCFLTLRTLK